MMVHPTGCRTLGPQATPAFPSDDIQALAPAGGDGVKADGDKRYRTLSARHGVWSWWSHE